jgi:hypothetical protein
VSYYRTEFIVPPDRYVCLQLPLDLPEGRATITITVHPDESRSPTAVERPVSFSESEYVPEGDLDQQDIEWWEEFDPS